MSRLTAQELQNLPENPDTNIAEAGKDVLLYIGKSGSGTTEAFALVGGQRNSTIEMSANSLDASHKGSGGWTANKPGLKSWKSSFKFVYPDASYQIGWAYITEFTRDNPHDGIATIKATMEGVGEISEITAAGGN